MAETYLAEQFIYGKLAASASVHTYCADRIYLGRAPQTATLPWPAIIFQYMGGSDTTTTNRTRALTDMVYLIKVIDQCESYTGTVSNVADYIDLALHQVTGTVGSGTIILCDREAPFQMSEYDQASNKSYLHLGGIYRLWVDPD